VLEAGGHTPDEVTQALHDVENIGAPIREDFMSRARYFGGSCNLWAGRSMRLAPLDLAGRDWVADSAWPIGDEEVAVHHPRASAILKLPPSEQFDVQWYRTRLSRSASSLVSKTQGQPGDPGAWWRTPRAPRPRDQWPAEDSASGR
jgi:hypothetical protein